ncbi:MAG TPA: alpha-1,4-glucan--maltose-1-phosphate maltosyltransferase [Sandaracinaceae bacterium LLY-WYZ-13_1]|nr:alpha-1,4-glucan--maltose-1-phosphate maltosyltransferase [Sandaracinaceae bacterium LLY-WYZ-13_1]
MGDSATSIEPPLPEDGRRRVFVNEIRPRVDGGRYAAKRVLGDRLRVEAALVCEGHDRVAGVLRTKRPGDEGWEETRLVPRVNDRFVGTAELDTLGAWALQIEAWVDEFGSWRHGLERKAEVGEATDVDLKIGAGIVEAAARRAHAVDAADAELLGEAARELGDGDAAIEARVDLALSAPLLDAVEAHPDRRRATRTDPWPLTVDPSHARYASWYELFPRSTGPGTSHGTFETAAEWLPYVAEMGFDVVYLPPIHPIGRTFRKGPNNTLEAGPDDPGSPWAIGAAEGGHTAVHPALGTLADFDRFVQRAGEHGLQVALDVAFQASPDHPWVAEHPSWFRARPDGTIQYAENPPKKYQDVYPFDFETDDWKALWEALRDVFLFWIDHGVTIFRVDNPHTKPVAFWDWCLASVKARHPEATFLSEAFTRPHLKYALGKVGFTQGYTYFTWRRTAWEMRQYLTELTRTEIVDYFRPSFWPNTPDILPEDLQHGGRPAFLSRLVMAGTLSSHYGIYGPAFELMEHEARPGSGEYVDNEKYEIKDWDRSASRSLKPVIAAVNRIRRDHPALQRNDTLVFHPTDNDALLCYSKRAGDDVVLVVVSFDVHHRRSGWIQLDAEALGIDEGDTYQVHDLLGGGRYLWSGTRNYVELDPHAMPAQVFALRRRLRTERDFDYFM